MNDTRCEKLFEHLTETNEEILARAYRVANVEELQAYGCISKKKSSKRTVSPHTLREVTALAICFVLLITGVVFVPKLFSARSYDTENNVINQYSICDSSDSEKSGKTQEKLVITGGVLLDNTFCEEEGVIPSRGSKYLSPLLENKMIEHQSENVLYRVIVEILITGEEYDEFEENLMNDSYYSLLYYRWTAICAEYDTEYDELGRRLTQAGENPEKIMKTYNELDEKKTAAVKMTNEYYHVKNKYVEQFRNSIIKMRQKYAFFLSETEPVSTSYAAFSRYEYHGGSYILELSADEINDLSEMGGYLILLASEPDEILSWMEEE